MLYSVGHSTLSKEDFISMISEVVSTIIDVRSHPTSRWEQFQKPNMESWLPVMGVKYEWWPELGGWDVRHADRIEEMAKYGVNLKPYIKGHFPKQHIAVKDEPDTRQEFLPGIKPTWTNIGLRDYSYFEMLPEFLEGCDKLIQRSKTESIAFMCCESQWWRCHRSMISDYLAFRDIESIHIMPHLRQKNKIKFVDGHKLISHSTVLGNRLERYDTPVKEAWESWK